jgi:hypothetical protein
MENFIMKTILVIILFVFGVLAALALGSGLLVLLAYAVGWLLNFVMHFDPFQITLLSLAGVLVFGVLATRIWEAITNFPPLSNRYEDDEDEDEDEDDEDDEDDFEYDEKDEAVIYPGIPLWRQPLKKVDFSNVRPDDRCPCGSGRKYKNCHGAKRPK